MKRRILSFALTLVMVFLALPVTLFAATAAELDPIVELEFTNDEIKWGGAFRTSGYLDATKSVNEENGESFYSFTITKRGSNKSVGTTIIVNDGDINVRNMNYVLVDYRYIMAERELDADGKTLAYPAEGTKWYLLVILEDGTEFGFDCDTIISDNGMDTSGQWATMKFNISNILDDMLIKELWIYPYVANQAEITDTAYPARPRGQTAYSTNTGAQSSRIAYAKGDIIDIKSVSYLITCWATLDFDGTVLDHSEYALGDEYVLPEPNASKRGYDFVGWTDGTNFYNVGDTVILSQNTTFSAVFEMKPIHTATAISEGKTVSSSQIIDGEIYTLPVMPRKDGYNFVGWYDGETMYAAREQIVMTTSKTFTAVFSIKEDFDVTVESDGTVLDSTKVTDGLTYTLPAAVEKYGYTFVGWSDGKTTYSAGTKVKIRQATTFTAVFDKKPTFTVTLIVNNEVVDTIVMVTGETFTLPAGMTVEGYDFKNWTDGNKTYAAGAQFTMTKDLTFTANLTAKTVYTSTVVVDGVTVSTESIYKGESVTLPAAPAKDGYIFVAWTDGMYKYAGGDKVKLIGDTTFTAVFAQDGASRETVKRYNNPFTFDGTSFSGGSGSWMKLSYANTTMMSSFTDENGKTGTTLNAMDTTYAFVLGIGKVDFPKNATITFDLYFNDLPTYEEGTIGIFTDRGREKSAIVYTLANMWLRVWTDENGKSWMAMEECDTPVEITTNTWYNVKFFGAGTSDNLANEKIQGWVKAEGESFYRDIGQFKNCKYIDIYNKQLFGFCNNAYATYTISNFEIATKEDDYFVKLHGVQYSEAENGKYNIRFAAGLGNLVEGQTAVGFEIVCGALGKKWTMEASKVYKSILASYGHETITAADLGSAYISTFTLKNVPVSAGKIALVCTPYVVVKGQKYYGSSVTVTYDPAAQ